MTDPQADAIERLQVLTDDESFVILVGGGDAGLDCILDAGNRSPTATQFHLLAVYLQTLADNLGTDVQTVVEGGVEALAKMEQSGANMITLEINPEEGQ